MRIYTKSGDGGETSLLGPQRVSKSHPRVEAYGTVDELNSCLGWCAVLAGPEEAQLLRTVQARLLDIGGELAATDSATVNSLPQVQEGDVVYLETAIDALSNSLPPLKQFILPGGGEYAARLHLVRTVARRAERRIVAISQTGVRPVVLQYLNRLSDLLFVMARFANAQSGVGDVPRK